MTTMQLFKAPRKPALNLEDLAGLQVPYDLHISPDGKHVVYAVSSWVKKDEHPASPLWVAEVGKEKSAKQFTSGLANDEQPQWSPDGKYIAFKSDRSKAGECSAIYLISPGGGEAYPITPSDNKREITSFQWSPNGKFIAYISAGEQTDEQARKEKEKDDAKVWGEDWKHCRLRCIHVDTRQITTLVSGDRHVAHFSWSADSQEITYTEHKTPDFSSGGLHGARIKTVNLGTKKSAEIMHFPGPVYSVARGDDGIYFTAGVVETHCSTSRAIYKLTDKSYARVAFGLDDCCLALRKSGGSVVVRVQSGLHDEIYGVHHGQVKLLHRTMNDVAAFDVSLVEDKAIVAFTKGDGSHPEEVFSVDTSSSIIQLSNHNATLAALNIAEAQPVYTTASDGYKLDGVLYLPSNHKSLDKPLPTILLVHGGPYYRLSIGFSVCHYLEMPLLVSAGYAVLCPNYRGGSGHGQEHAAYARAGMGTVEYNDCIAILQAGIAGGVVDANRAAIGGWSQGGYMSYLAVTRSDFSFRGAVCGAGVCDWDTIAMTSDAYWFEADLAGGAPWEVDAEDGEDEQGRRWIRDTQGRRGSALWHMKNVKTPILILHGEEDVRVPLSQAVAFYRGCLHHNVPVKMVTYPREGHLFTERKHVVDLWSRMQEFYDLHLS